MHGQPAIFYSWQMARTVKMRWLPRAHIAPADARARAAGPGHYYSCTTKTTARGRLLINILVSRLATCVMRRKNGKTNCTYLLDLQSAHPFSLHFGTGVPEFCEILIC